MGQDAVHGSDRPYFIGPAEARPLFGALEKAEPETRLALLDAATRLPLDRPCWFELRRYVERELADPDPATHAQAIEIAARVPMQSIRSVVRDLAWEPHRDEGRAAAFALAQMRDVEAVGPLIELLGDPGVGADAARLLARLDVTGHATVLKARFDKLGDTGEPAIERFWLALALARTGEDSQLFHVLDGLRTGDELPILWGDPGVVSAELDAGPPLPAPVRDRLRSRVGHASGEEATLVELLLGGPDVAGAAPPTEVVAPVPEPPSAAVVESTRAQVAEELGRIDLFDEHGRPRRDGEAEIGAMLNRLESTTEKPAVLSAAVSELFRFVLEAGADHSMWLGNSVARLAAEPAYVPDLEGLFDAFQLAEASDATTTVGAQIGWAASRTTPSTLVAGLATQLSNPETGLDAARLVAEAGTYLGTTSPPIFGGAPVPPGPRITEELIEDRTALLEVEDVMGGPAVAAAPVEPEADAPRWLLASVKDVATGGLLTKAFKSDAKHVISVAIGPEQEGALAATGGETFDKAMGPVENLPELLVVFTPPPTVGNQQRGTIVLPPTGTSAWCPFYVDVPGDCDTFESRVEVYHRNRLVQMGILEGPVVAVPDRARDSAITFELAVITPVTSDLESRQQYDAAFTKTALATTGVADDLIPIDIARIEEAGTNLVALLTNIVSGDAARSRHLEDAGVIDGLRGLAWQGRMLYEAFSEQLEGRQLDRLQVLVEDATDFFPIEFVYDLPVPANDAGLCPGWKTALKRKDGKCPEQHAPKGVLQQAEHVCPSGFWSLSKVIERQVVGPTSWKPLNLGDARFAVRAHPKAGLDRLSPPASVVFAASNRVDCVRRGGIAGVSRALCRLWSSTVSVDTWAAWVEAVQAHNPSLLVLLSHTEVVSTQSALEIGAADRCQLAQLGPHYIRTGADEHPIVLLLGCETAVANFQLQTFVARFQDLGAAVVVGTVASVLGERVASVAKTIAREIDKASRAKQTTSTGELMRHVRRKLLSQGELTALCLTGFGDAQWQLGG